MRAQSSPSRDARYSSGQIDASVCSAPIAGQRECRYSHLARFKIRRVRSRGGLDEYQTCLDAGAANSWAQALGKALGISRSRHDQFILTMPAPTLETLPVETRQAILGELADVRSLRRAAIACPALYEAFISAQYSLTSKVLSRHLPQDILPEASAALQSASISPWPRSETQEFVARHFYTRNVLHAKWTLKEALSVMKLYDHISYFANTLAKEALASEELKGACEPASRTELARIERALYRFQIYCNLFPGLKRPLFDAAFQKALYFNKFSPWENEQLAAVHDFLHRSVCPGMSNKTPIQLSSDMISL